jgi:hypothetical protein
MMSGANDLRALAGSRGGEVRNIRHPRYPPHGSGPRARPFAAGNNRLRIIEGGELKHLLEEYLHIDVRIDLARRAHKWPFEGPFGGSWGVGAREGPNS